MGVLELGWATLTEAKSYFTNERYVTTYWDAISSDDNKNKILNMSYNRIYYDPDYSVPSKANATATQKVILIKAQCELAYYLGLHLADEDRRKGLQAQAVTAAGIVKESYLEGDLSKMPLPPFVKALLESFWTPTAPFYARGIDRDEDEDIDEGEGT